MLKLLVHKPDLEHFRTTNNPVSVSLISKDQVKSVYNGENPESIKKSEKSIV